ncbi:MAG: hypothetical protein ABEJ72_01630, partial [Candidatus Aenigmatarchaeota archaeon]
MISDAEAQGLKKNSLEKARKTGILEEDILEELEDIDVRVEARGELEETGQRILFGYSRIPGKPGG